MSSRLELIDDIFHYLLEYSKIGEHRHELTITDFSHINNFRIDIGNYMAIMVIVDDLIVKFNIGWIISFNDYDDEMIIPLDKCNSEYVIDLVNPESIPNMIAWIDDQVGDYEVRLELVEWENALGIEPSSTATLAERIAVITPLAPTCPLCYNNG